jgi:DNA-binding CsgD family transcriptional regulator
MSATYETDKGVCLFCEDGWKGLSQELALSKREVEIIQCLMLDDDEGETATFLGISRHSVHTHLKRLYEKLHVKSRMALITLLVDAHLTWLCEASPPPGCRLNRRLVEI